MRKRIIYNNFIRAPKVRLIDQNSQQVGIVELTEALKKAKEAGLDLIQVTEKTDPPVCKITNYGKYSYQLEKKERRLRHHSAGEIKNIRLSFAISQHDIETRAKQAEKFLREGSKVRIEMVLRGRQKALGDFAREKFNKFLTTLKTLIEYKLERELKREQRGFTMMITRAS